MRPEDVREHLDRRPFEPFRICMSDGQCYDVRHPELCMVGRSAVYVGVPDPELSGLVLRVDHCALIHITRMQPLNSERKRSGGKRRRG